MTKLISYNSVSLVNFTAQISPWVHQISSYRLQNENFSKINATLQHQRESNFVFTAKVYIFIHIFCYQKHIICRSHYTPAYQNVWVFSKQWWLPPLWCLIAQPAGIKRVKKHLLFLCTGIFISTFGLSQFISFLAFYLALAYYRGYINSFNLNYLFNIAVLVIFLRPESTSSCHSYYDMAHLQKSQWTIVDWQVG